MLSGRVLLGRTVSENDVRRCLQRVVSCPKVLAEGGVGGWCREKVSSEPDIQPPPEPPKKVPKRRVKKTETKDSAGDGTRKYNIKFCSPWSLFGE